ncbi:MAG: PAS domain S-box protein [Balneolaceae bacterium]|nr:PAS domain S-box protein [Balneolaceae bacterium]
MKLGFNKTDLLLKIVSQRHPNLETQLENALKWSTESLGMEIGIISHIEEDSYTVKNFFPEESGMQKNQVFKLSDTYCSLAINQDDVFKITEMGKSEYKNEPCYGAFGLESYIGKPFQIEGNLYGTINFSSTSSHEEFSIEELSFMKLLSEWVGSTLHRIQMTKQLEEEHKLYKILTNNSAELICLHDLDGTYNYVSPSVKNLLGFSPRELIGQSPYQFFHPADIERISNESHEEAKKGNVYPSMQYRIRRKDGRYVWFDTATQPVTNEKGEVVSLQTTSREITERKRIEILFEQAQQMAKIGGWDYDIETGKLFWSKQVYQIHELDPDTELYVEDGLSYYPTGGPRETLEKALNNSIENGTPTELDLPLITAKGNHRWIRIIVNPELLGTNVVKLFGSFQDITESKRLEELFRESQKMAKVGGWEYDLITGDLFWSDEVYRIHEVELGTPVKVEDGVKYYPEGFSRDSINAAIGNAIETGEGWDVELPFITAKGRELWVRAKGIAEFVDGKAIRLKGTFQDITERKEREEKIKEQVKQLSDLTNTREKLYAVIAHDLKNSIFGVKGLLDLLIEDIEEPDYIVDIDDVLEKLKLVFISADFSHKLLQNMLTWVRLQSGLLNPKVLEFDVANSLEVTVGILRPALSSKNITVNTKIEGETAIEGDPNLVSTIFRNLLNNAVKFSNPNSDIDLTINASCDDEIVITVKDYGTGMDEETIQNLFNEEFRPQMKGTQKEKGTGLGLILVKELLEKQQGRVTVHSSMGNGAEFIVTLPKKLEVAILNK